MPEAWFSVSPNAHLFMLKSSPVFVLYNYIYAVRGRVSEKMTRARLFIMSLCSAASRLSSRRAVPSFLPEFPTRPSGTGAARRLSCPGKPPG
jgi:hypothetical protein